MSPTDLIDSYVSDVVRLLPSSQRHDIALELRSLLADELAEARATAEPPNDSGEQLVLDLLNRFGHPADVAARYRPSAAVVGRVDRRRFWTAAAAGVVVILALAVRNALHQPAAGTGDVLAAAGALWVAFVVQSALWLALIAAAFSSAAWVRRHWPRSSGWKPRPVRRDRISRVGNIVGVVAAVAATTLLIYPTLPIDYAFGGRAAPAAYQALAYDTDFLRLRAPLVLALLGARLVLQLVVIVRGRWDVATRQVDVGLALAICAVLAWTVVAGPVFEAPPTDQLVRALLILIIVSSLVDAGLKLRRLRRHPATNLAALN